MSKRTVTLVFCDLLHDDETPASQTITVQLERESVELDLCEEHVAAVVDPLRSVGRVIRKPGRKPRALAAAN